MQSAARHSRGIAASLGMAAVAELSGGIENAAVRGEAQRFATLLEQLDSTMGEGVARLRILCGCVR